MKKRIISLMLALILVLSMSINAFATPSNTNSGTVTVYVTYGMFETDSYTGIQSYIGGNPSQYLNANFYIDGSEFDIDEIAEYHEYFRDVYGAPNTLSYNPNVLDAIILAFANEGVDFYEDIIGYWDANPVVGEPGGVIHSVDPNYGTVTQLSNVTIDGQEYERYVGNGWNFAYGTSLNNLTSSDVYGTSIPVTDDMIIVFDFSPYRIYWPVS